MAKVAISISDDLLRDMDVYAKSNYMTRSGFISMCCAQYLQAIEMQRLVSSISDSMERLAKSAETGSIDEATLKEVQNFQNLAKVISDVRLLKR